MNQSIFKKDPANKKIHVIRVFNASLSRTWAAWTEAELLDQWWAPKPWKAATKKMDFREGGTWLYAMKGPDGTEHWSRADFIRVQPMKEFANNVYFCDAEGVKNPEMPTSTWNIRFVDMGVRTEVQVELEFDREEDLLKMVEMGFETGFTMAHGNLDELLAGS